MNRPHHYNNEYRRELFNKIESLPAQVFTRQDLATSQSNQEQLRLNRALKAFLDAGTITKLGHGLYGKAMQMDFPNGETKTVLRDSFESVAIEALNKLGLKWEFGRAIQEYNRGETTQVPVVFCVKLLSRFRGSIVAEGRKIIFEDGINAR